MGIIQCGCFTLLCSSFSSYCVAHSPSDRYPSGNSWVVLWIYNAWTLPEGRRLVTLATTVAALRRENRPRAPVPSLSLPTLPKALRGARSAARDGERRRRPASGRAADEDALARADRELLVPRSLDAPPGPRVAVPTGTSRAHCSSKPASTPPRGAAHPCCTAHHARARADRTTPGVRARYPGNTAWYRKPPRAQQRGLYRGGA